MNAWFAALRMALLCALLLPGLARAGGFVRVDEHALVRQGECFVLNAPWQVAQVDHKLRDALQHGVKLHFVQSFELFKPQDWWFNKTVTTQQRELTLSYSALVDAWRIEQRQPQTLDCGGGAEPSVRQFRTLAEALGAIGSVRGWRVLRQEAVGAGQKYEAALRIHLDIGRLPQMLQLSALTNDRWELDSNWQRWGWSPEH
jgi:hypothetical protein